MHCGYTIFRFFWKLQDNDTIWGYFPQTKFRENVIVNTALNCNFKHCSEHSYELLKMYNVSTLITFLHLSKLFLLFFLPYRGRFHRRKLTNISGNFVTFPQWKFSPMKIIPDKKLKLRLLPHEHTFLKWKLKLSRQIPFKMTYK